MKKATSLLTIVLTSAISFGQTINLTEQLKSNKINVVNRRITEYKSDGIQLDAHEGDGLAILETVEFNKGMISIEIKGENAPGRSFVGLAFNIQNDTTYEAVYFRPFNFIAKEPIRRSHMAQYIYHPVYTWYKLREERTGEFENELQTPPQPDDWFMVTIVVTDDKIMVYVNEEKAPSLEVKRLTVTGSKKIGLWTGNGSSGRFRNLTISNKD